MTLLLIALGGALGSVCRYLLATTVQKSLHSGFPFGTMTVNILGSLIVGLLTGWLMNAQTHPLVRPALVVGFCGGFTTFSTFSMETVGLVTGGEVALALAYAGMSVVCCLAGAAAGFALARPS